MKFRPGLHVPCHMNMATHALAIRAGASSGHVRCLFLLRTCLLWYTALVCNACILLEQPLHRDVYLFKGPRWQELAMKHTATGQKTVMSKHAFLSFVAVLSEVYKCFAQMAAFGAATLKPSTFWSNHRDWLQFLQLETSADDKKRVRGCKRPLAIVTKDRMRVV